MPRKGYFFGDYRSWHTHSDLKPRQQIMCRREKTHEHSIINACTLDKTSETLHKITSSSPLVLNRSSGFAGGVKLPRP